jgi:hypothetical protein
LLGLIMWNVVVCGWMLLAEVRQRPGKFIPFRSQRMREHLDKQLTNSVPDPKQREILSRSTLTFLERWHTRTAPQAGAQWKLVFHLGALLLAGGMVASMYAQGLRKEYGAGWESTFLDEHSLHGLLQVALAPASALTGIPVPQAAELREMRVHPELQRPVATASAAPFIHLWAATAGLFIGLPRILLIALALREGRKERPNWEPDLQAYVAKIQQAAAGQVAVVDVLPVYFTPEAASAEAMRHCVLQHWGGKARVNFLTPLTLGDEDAGLSAWQPASHGTVVAFSFASTPEQDVQGEVIREAVAKAAKLMVITDALSFEARHGALPEFPQRMAQRTAAWKRLIGDALPWVNLTAEVVKNPLAAMDTLRL